MTIQLRPDQERPLAELYAAVRAGYRRPLLQGPTGWGKGTVAAHVLARVAAGGKKGAFICHREEINLDLVGRLRAAGCPSVRIIMGDTAEGDSQAAVTVASVQTIDARDLVLDADVLWWDEAHRAASSSYERARARMPDAYHVGSSATPARADGRPLTFFDTLIQGPQVGELLALGNLAPVHYEAPDSTLEGLAAKPEDVYPVGRPGVVFASNREHGRALRVLLRRRGIRAEYVDGDTPARAAILQRFTAGDDCDVLVNVHLLNEGVDIPRAEVCMFACRVGSTVAFLQRIGRVRRPRPGKVATVLDLSGSLWLHGHPDADRSYSLGEDGAPAIRLKEALLSCVQCPGCLGWGAASAVCEACGHQRPGPRAPKLTKAQLREQRLERMPRTGPDYELWSQLVQTQRARNYKPQWAAIQFMQQTGRRPRWGLKQVPTDAA